MGESKNKLRGELLILAAALSGSLLPIFSSPQSIQLSPLWIVATGTVISLLFFLTIFCRNRRYNEIRNIEALKLSALVGLIIGVGATGLVYIGSYYTSPQNASILVSFDVLVAMLMFRKVDSEKLSIKEIIGGLLLVSAGAILFLPKSSQMNIGDILLLLNCFLTPVGNLLMKKARALVSSETILLVRTIVSSAVLTCIAFVADGLPDNHSFSDSIPKLFLNGVIVLGLSKILWLEGVRLIPIAKASSIISVSPVMTFVFAWIFLNDSPSWNQLMAIPACLAGLMLVIKPRSRSISDS